MVLARALGLAMSMAKGVHSKPKSFCRRALPEMAPLLSLSRTQRPLCCAISPELPQSFQGAVFLSHCVCDEVELCW